METMTVTINSVNVFTDGNKVRVQLGTDKVLKQFVQARDDNGKALGFDTMSEQEVPFIKMPMAKLIAQLKEKDDTLNLYFAMLDKAASKKELVLLLLGSQLTIAHELHAEGEVVGEGDDAYTYEHDTYTTDVKGVALCKRAKEYIDKFMFM